jgi:hypothetical protein
MVIVKGDEGSGWEVVLDSALGFLPTSLACLWRQKSHGTQRRFVYLLFLKSQDKQKLP